MLVSTQSWIFRALSLFEQQVAEEIHKRLCRSLKKPWTGNERKKIIFVCLSHSLSVLQGIAFFSNIHFIKIPQNKKHKVNLGRLGLPQLLICMFSLLCYQFQAVHTLQHAYWYFRWQENYLPRFDNIWLNKAATAATMHLYSFLWTA